MVQSLFLFNFTSKAFHRFLNGRIHVYDGTGRDGKTVVHLLPWPLPHFLPARRQFHLPSTRTVPSHRDHISRCKLPPHPVEVIRRCRPVPPPNPALTVLSRRHSLLSPSRPANAGTLFRQAIFNSTVKPLLPVKYVTRRKAVSNYYQAWYVCIICYTELARKYQIINYKLNYESINTPARM